jgi:hypothetical protein
MIQGTEARDHFAPLPAIDASKTEPQLMPTTEQRVARRARKPQERLESGLDKHESPDGAQFE